MMQSSYAQLSQIVAPEILVAATALLVLMIDVIFLRKRSSSLRLKLAAGLGITGCLIAAWHLMASSATVALGNGVFLSNPLTRVVALAILGLTVAALALSINSRFTEHVGEFVLLILLATVGMMFLVSTQNLLVLFISLELLSLSLYLLTAFDKSRPVAAEASLKYFLFGGMSAAFLLYGFSILYGFANSTDLAVIGTRAKMSGTSPLIVLAVVTTIIGFGFKVAAVPFHFWTPDVYESAPNPVAAFIASASKVASFFAFFTVLTVGFGSFAGSADWFHVFPGWTPVVAALAALSMILGNLGALAQTSMRRLLAYSAIAHSGYMLIAIVSHTLQSLAALLYYVITYGIATLGAFAVVAVVEQETGGDQMENFNGLSRRMPLLSACLFVFLLSQAGIPPLAGFFGKFYLFISAVAGAGNDRGLLWLVILAIGMSAVSLYYYLQVLKRVFVTEPKKDAAIIQTPPLTRIRTAMLAILTVLLGCAPYPMLHWLLDAIQKTMH